MSEQNLPKVWLLDASIVFFRAWFGLPDHFHTKDGQSINGLFGFAKSLLDLLAQSPQYLVCAYDESLFTGLRHQIDPEYKANRVLPDEDLEFQLEGCKTIAELLGLPVLASDDYEADDLIASAQAQWFPRTPVAVITADKDLGQLIRQGDIWWNPAKNDQLDAHAMAAKWGVECNQLANLLALTGDQVDNIPGVPGVGDKTAAALLNAFGTVTELFDNLDDVARMKIRGAKTLGAKLAPHRDRVLLNLQLTQTFVDAPLPSKPKPWSIRQGDWQALAEQFEDWNMPRTVKNRLQHWQ